MSFFIRLMPVEGLMFSPPVSKQTPLPTSVSRGPVVPQAQVDQARRARAGAADRVDHREVLRQQIVAQGDGDGGPMRDRQVAGGLFQLGRTHVLRGRVDQVAGQELARGHGGQAGGIDAGRRLDAGLGLFGQAGAVAVKAVLDQQGGQGGLIGLRLGQGAVQVPVACGQAGKGLGQAETAAAAGLVGAQARNSPRDAARSGQQPQVAQCGLEARGAQPVGLRAGGQKGLKPLGRHDVQRQRGGSGVGEGRGHGHRVRQVRDAATLAQRPTAASPDGPR
jgi:hypothetical protein